MSVMFSMSASVWRWGKAVIPCSWSTQEIRVLVQMQDVWHAVLGLHNPSRIHQNTHCAIPKRPHKTFITDPSPGCGVVCESFAWLCARMVVIYRSHCLLSSRKQIYTLSLLTGSLPVVSMDLHTLFSLVLYLQQFTRLLTERRPGIG